jgi:uncharacterized protein
MSLLPASARASGGDPSIVGMYRHAVKGLSADSLEQVSLHVGETFPDDRRFALLKKDMGSFSPNDPEWLHKENFLCAFTAPKLMASLDCSYRMQGTDLASFGLPCDVNIAETVTTTKRLLTIRDRLSKETLLKDIDLASNEGKEQLTAFLSHHSNEDVVCVTADSKDHFHQFGNIFYGAKATGYTRTIHIINAETVKEISTTFGCHINPTRFRLNIVIQGLAPWEEFNWVGKEIECGGTKLRVIKRTIRCEGINVDPLDPNNDDLDIPGLLTKHYPKYGPYLGVYAQVVEGGIMKIGDSLVQAG